jgi:hypothetical protein
MIKGMQGKIQRLVIFINQANSAFGFGITDATDLGVRLLCCGEYGCVFFVWRRKTQFIIIAAS